MRGLGVGAPVEFLGIQVGLVTSIALDIDEAAGRAVARVRFDVEPQRIGRMTQDSTGSPEAVAERLVSHGLRAQLRSASLLTGQLVLGLDFVPGCCPGGAGARR